MREAFLSLGIKLGDTRFAAPLKQASEEAFGPELRETKEVPAVVPYATLLRSAVTCYKAVHLQDAGVSLDDYLPRVRNVYAEYGRPGDSDVYEISPRRYQQLLGTEVVRHFKDSAFLDRVRRDAVAAGDSITLVRDMRFDNEVRSMDYGVHVYRPGAAEVADHASEQLAKRFDELILKGFARGGQEQRLQFGDTTIYVVVNQGTVQDLKFQALNVATKLLGQYREHYKETYDPAI
jgi:hypothetical protein